MTDAIPTAPAARPSLTLFALGALLPLPLLALGLAGGAWAFAGLVWMTLFVGLADQYGPRLLADAPPGAEFPAADPLLVAIALAHLATLPLAVWAVAGDSGLGTLDRVALFAGFGLWFGQVANPAAHELIHRGDRRLFRLGAAIYTSLLFGHHTSAHRLVHHRHAASREDPNTARAGEGFWRFFLRAWAGSFRLGWRAEAARLRPALHPYAPHPYAPHPYAPHPYTWYLGGAAAAIALGWAIAGPLGAGVWAGLALHAQSQLLLSDYVQHYGLARARLPDGRLEPVGDRHSWNAPHLASSAMMLNAPRHSDHHAHPARPYPALRLPGATDAPRLPYALPVSCVLALVPPLWRRVMHPHLAQWRRESGEDTPSVPRS